MSSYTKSTNFASKDALLTGNPLKVIKGTEIDDEYNAIQTAINSKADTNSPALTGTPTSTTASAGTNTTQIATTAFVKTAIDAIPTPDLSSLYPVGSIYINASVSTNPATLIGFGTWEAFGAGRVLVGLDSGQTEFDTLGETGGAKTHTLTVNEMPAHTHSVPNSGSQNNSFDSGTTVGNDVTGTSGSTGGGQAHNNLQPYIVVYMWKRTA
jgi:microcystin-dependent protein